MLACKRKGTKEIGKRGLYTAAWKTEIKVGEEVCFVYGKDRDQEAKGRICIIDAYGTWE